MKSKNPSFFISVIQWIGFALVSWSLGVWFNHYFPTPDAQWLKFLYDRKVTALQQQDNNNPRLIIIGGSGTFFGIDSNLLEDQLKMPVINAGVHAGLGLNATLNLFEPYIRAGDQVLVIPEYGLLSSFNGVEQLASTMGVAISRPTIGARTIGQAFEQTLGAGRPGLQAIAYSLNQQLDMIQNVKGYAALVNRRGDAIKLPMSRYSVAPSWNPDPIELSEYSIQELRRFRQQVESHGAHLTIGLPWLLAKNKPEMVTFLRKNMVSLQKVAPVIFNPETLNCTSDTSLFSDTVYHLSVKGRQVRSQELARQLKALWLLP